VHTTREAISTTASLEIMNAHENSIQKEQIKFNKNNNGTVRTKYLQNSTNILNVLVQNDIEN